MTALANALTQYATATLAPPAVQTSTFTSSALDILDYEGQFAVHQIVGTVTAGSLAGKIQHCDTSGGSYVDVPNAAFTTVSVSTDIQKLLVDTNACKRFIKYVGTITGTSVAFSVMFEGMKKVR